MKQKRNTAVGYEVKLAATGFSFECLRKTFVFCFLKEK